MNVSSRAGRAVAAARRGRRSPVRSRARGTAVTPSRRPAAQQRAHLVDQAVASNIASVRWASRSSRIVVSQSNPTMTVSQRGAPIVGADAANGWPVSSTTSSARTMRRPSVARIDAAADGVDRGQLGVQRGDADLGQPLLPAGPHGRVGGREGPVVEQRLDVHHRSADDDRDGAARPTMASTSAAAACW